LICYGELAQKDFIDKEQAIRLAWKSGIFLSEEGGTGEGIIGALAAVGLRGSGNGGRYVHLQGIREIKGLVTVSSILKDTGITAVVDEGGRPVGGGETVDSQDWIKPNVIGGNPVLRIRLRGDVNGGQVWETVEQKHRNNCERQGRVL
jgi:hypothetical protein